MSNPSTGPRSVEGKERASLNAVKHGLRSERPVLPGEDAAEWDAFRAEIVRDLDPAGTLETELAERVALQMWRLRRAAPPPGPAGARARRGAPPAPAPPPPPPPR